MTTQEIAAPASREAFVRRAGAWCLAAGLLGAASGIFLAVVPPQVDETVYSYPLGNSQFAAIQVFFFLQHLPLLIGLLGLSRSGALGPGRPGRAGVVGAVAGMALLAATELAAISAANSPYPSPRTDVLDAMYGVSSMLIGIGMVIAGIAMLRARRWTGWRAGLVLATGAYVFVPMIPALMGPFVLARLAIAGWMLLFAALGWVLLRSEGRPGDPA